jgi:Cu/Ag efflux pump CusA
VQQLLYLWFPFLFFQEWVVSLSQPYKEGDFAFHCILPQGTSLSQSLETSMQASRLIKEFDEVKMVVGKTGSAEVPYRPNAT